jgi:hypothetical protein
MPHASLKTIPGVDVNRTMTLNEAAISSCDLIRFIPDRQGAGLVQKLGGWTTYFPNQIDSIIRALWPWEDTNGNTYLAVGAEQSLSYIESNNQSIITPRTLTNNPTVSISVSVGSSDVTITDVGSSITQWDNVYIQTPISVGGLILFGVYPCTNPTNDPDTYHITAVDALGDPVAATTTAAAVVAAFSVTSGSANFTVTLTNHGYNLYQTFAIVIPTVVAGVTLYGNYIIQSITDANNFIIVANNTATSTVTSQLMNSGNARYVYYIGVGPSSAGTGYGIGGYGMGGYGVGVPFVPQNGQSITTQDWTLDNWGEILISCPLNGPIYEWSPAAGYSTSAVIGAAPIVNAGIVIAMPQRQLIAWGSTETGIQDPLLIRWCDVDNYTEWNATVTNQAGSYRIPRGSRIVQCIQAAQQTLVWSDLALWSMQYVGQPYVYQFNEIGTGCGLIGRKAATSMSGIVYWMGQSQFYMLAGSGPQPIPCPVWDVIFQDLDTSNLDKIRVAPNSRFGEVSWYYPIKGTSEISGYVKYNVVLQQWDYGTLARTAWTNESVLGPPIGAGTDRYIYQHETSTNAAYNGINNQPMLSNFQTGYFVIADADLKMFVDQVWPDMKWGYYGGTANGTTVYQTPTAEVQLTFYAADYAGETPLAYGPYNLTQSTQFVSPRFRGRLVSVSISSSDVGSFWRIGNIRYRVQPDGKF